MQNNNTSFDISLNLNVRGMPVSATLFINELSNKLKQEGKKIYRLGLGQSPFPVPKIIVEELRSNAFQKDYQQVKGLLPLREAVADYHSRRNDLQCSAEDVLIGPGSKELMFLLQFVYYGEILIPTPSWVSYAPQAKIIGRQIVWIDKKEIHRWRLLPDDLHRICKSDPSRPRLVILNYPSNPTGAYPTREYLQRLHDFAKAHDLWIVSDEVYGSLYYGERPASAAAFDGAKDRTLLVNSLSKSYAMTGWRVGFLAAPKQVIDNALKAGQNSITCVAPFIQKAAAFALTDPEIQQVTANMRAAYARRRELVLRLSREFESEKVLVTPPQGAFYFFLDFRPLKMSSLEICEKILDEAGVGLIPGSAFGAQGEGFVRMTIAASDEDVEGGFRKIIAWAEKQQITGAARQDSSWQAALS